MLGIRRGTATTAAHHGVGVDVVANKIDLYRESSRVHGFLEAVAAQLVPVVIGLVDEAESALPLGNTEKCPSVVINHAVF